MRRIFSSIYSFFDSPLTRRKLFVLFLITFFIKLSCILYLRHLATCNSDDGFRQRGFIAWWAGDSPTYLDPINNYIEKGEFYFTNTEHENIYIGRGPYYGIPYFLFRQFFNETVSYNLVALFQIALASLAVLYYCMLCRLLVFSFRNKGEKLKVKSEIAEAQIVRRGNLAFWFCFILFNLSLNTTILDNQLWTESFHISLFGFFAYHYFKYVNGSWKNPLAGHSRSFFYSAIFLALITVIKPYFCLLYIGVGIELLLGKSFGNAVKRAAMFSIPLIVAVLPWTIRNYVKYQRVVPIQELYVYHTGPAMLAYWHFVMAWGGSVVHWDKRSAGCYFEPAPNEECEFVFPEYVFTKQYSMKDIEGVRNDFIHYGQLLNSDSVLRTTDFQLRTLEDTVITKFNRMTAEFKEEKPFFYYVEAPLLCASKMIFHSGSYYLPIAKRFKCYQPWQMLIKISQSALYYLMLIFGWWGLIKAMRIRGMVLCAIIPLYLVWFMGFIQRAAEFRYFDTTYPFFVVGFVFLLMTSFPSKLQTNK